MMQKKINWHARQVTVSDVFDGIRVAFTTTLSAWAGQDFDATARNILVAKAQKIRTHVNRNIAEGRGSAFRRNAGAFGVGRIRVG